MLKLGKKLTGKKSNYAEKYLIKYKLSYTDIFDNRCNRR